MIKMYLGGLAVLFVICLVLSGGQTWGAILFQIFGAAWIIYCFSKL